MKRNKVVAHGTTRMGLENTITERTNGIHTERCLVREPTKYTQKDSRLFGYQETHSVSSLRRPRQEDWEF